MKNEDHSFSVLAAIIIAGVVLACVPTANSSVALNSEIAPVVAAATTTVSPKSEVFAVKAGRKSGTCANERRGEFKVEAKRAHAAKPAV